MVFSRNPDYHGRLTGNLQRVELSFGVDPSAQLEMYKAGSLDIVHIHPFPLPERDRIRQRHAGEYVSVFWLQTTYVGFDVSRPPFDDPRVRRAFVLATDRETLAEVFLGGYAAPATGGFIPPGMPGHSAGIGLPYDPDQARQLLAEAGYPGGRGFPAVDLLKPHGRFPYNEYLQAQWRENLGIEIMWEIVEFGEYVDRLSQELPHIFLHSFLADYPDPDSFLRLGLRRTRPRWRNKAYDELVEEARRVMDQGERMKMYRQADRILVEAAVVLPLTHERSHRLVKPWVRKYHTSSRKTRIWRDVIIEPH
jgi:ABC-type oligopeptide transport system substrate-binding subunit